MQDSFMLVERYNWTMHDVDLMDWSDYCAFVDGARLMFDRERKAHEAAMKGR